MKELAVLLVFASRADILTSIRGQVTQSGTALLFLPMPWLPASFSILIYVFIWSNIQLGRPPVFALDSQITTQPQQCSASYHYSGKNQSGLFQLKKISVFYKRLRSPPEETAGSPLWFMIYEWYETAIYFRAAPLWTLQQYEMRP